MFRYIIRAFILLAAVLTLTSMQAQDATFTQFYSQKIYLNPAFAGSNKCPRIISGYRNQWPGTGNFITSSISYDAESKTLHGGYAFLVTSDQFGQALTTNEFSAIYSYKTRLNVDWALRAAGQVTYRQRTLGPDLSFGDQIDGRYGFIYETNEFLNGNVAHMVSFSSGALLYSENLYIGLAAHHLNEPNESLFYNASRLPMKLTLHFGAKFPFEPDQFGENSWIIPSIIIQKQGEFRHMNTGLYVHKDALTLGVWHRGIFGTQYADAVVFTLGFDLKQFTFGYSYDLTISNLGVQNGGANEISMRFQIPCRTPKERLRSIPCPNF